MKLSGELPIETGSFTPAKLASAAAIATYYEYTGRDRLTDAEWRDKLSSPTPPPIPSWFAPYVAR